MTIETILVSICTLLVGGGAGFLVKMLMDKSLISSAKKDKEDVQKKVDDAIVAVKAGFSAEKQSWDIEKKNLIENNQKAVDSLETEKLQLQKEKTEAVDNLKSALDDLRTAKLQLEDAKSGFASTLAALKLTNLYDQININIRAKLDQLDKSLSPDGEASELTQSIIAQIIVDINSKNLNYNKRK